MTLMTDNNVYTHRSLISKPSKYIHKDGMLRGSEVSKDSYHSPVKK